MAVRYDNELNTAPQHSIALALTLANRVMFTHSKNVSISGGEFNVIYGGKNSETSQRGKHRR